MTNKGLKGEVSPFSATKTTGKAINGEIPGIMLVRDENRGLKCRVGRIAGTRRLRCGQNRIGILILAYFRPSTATRARAKSRPLASLSLKMP